MRGVRQDHIELDGPERPLFKTSRFGQCLGFVDVQLQTIEILAGRAYAGGLHDCDLDHGPSLEQHSKRGVLEIEHITKRSGKQSRTVVADERPSAAALL